MAVEGIPLCGSLKYVEIKERKMKKIICFVLALITVCLSLVACGPGGDTNMHKIMHAIEKENAILASTYSKEVDCYEDTSLSEMPYDNGWENVDHESTKAWADNVYYGRHILFNANRVELKKDSYAKDFDTKIYWNAKENTISISLREKYEYNVWNNKAKDPKYHSFKSDDGFEVSSYDSENAKLVFDMNIYYENGKFEVSDATYDINEFSVRNPGEIAGCEDIFVADMVELLNDALNGLNGIYKEKGYPIK